MILEKMGLVHPSFFFPQNTSASKYIESIFLGGIWNAKVITRLDVLHIHVCRGYTSSYHTVSHTRRLISLARRQLCFTRFWHQFFFGLLASGTFVLALGLGLVGLILWFILFFEPAQAHPPLLYCGLRMFTFCNVFLDIIIKSLSSEQMKNHTGKALFVS